MKVMGLAILALKAVSLLRGHKTINLIGEPRPGGYMFLKSPELPGFSMMLEPNQHDELGEFVKAVESPLVAFISAECRADEHAKRLKMMGATQTDSTTYLADLCAA
jgi:hypothetical protein